MDLSRPRTRTTLSWIPLALIVLALGASCIAGRSALVTGADASTSVPVTGSVSSSVFLDATACTPTAVAIGELVPGTDPWKTAQDNGGQTCVLSFGSPSSAAGATLSVMEDPAAPVSPAAAMKCVAGGCTGSALADYANLSGEPAIGTSAFGMQLLADSGAADGLWNVSPAVYPVADSASAACETTSVATGGCSFTFGASAGVTDQPGSYQARARALVIGN